MAASRNKSVIKMGDANLCVDKWKEANCLRKILASILTSTLAQYGLEISDLGPTYQADHAQSNVDISESSIDHIYYSKEIVDIIMVYKLSYG